MNMSLWCISNRPDRLIEVAHSIAPHSVLWMDGTNPQSFSRLVNQCVLRSHSEKVCIMSDRVRPTEKHIELMEQRLDQGYALVEMHRFGFFGLHKETMRRIGPMDERLAPGGFEDADYQCRLKEANLALYESEEVPMIQHLSSWNHDNARRVFYEKWIVDRTHFVLARLQPEPPSQYDFGPATGQHFLPWNVNTIMLPFSQWFMVARMQNLVGVMP